MQSIFEVVQILSKYHTEMWAEHKLIGFRPTLDGIETTISDTDLQRLKELGVFYDRNTNSLCIWV